MLSRAKNDVGKYLRGDFSSPVSLTDKKGTTYHFNASFSSTSNHTDSEGIRVEGNFSKLTVSAKTLTDLGFSDEKLTGLKCTVNSNTYWIRDNRPDYTLDVYFLILERA